MKRSNNGNERKCNGLVLGPLPPPSGGIATFCEDLNKSILKLKYRLVHFEVIQVNKTKSKFVKLSEVVFLYARFLKALLRNSPSFVHINTASYRNFFWNSIFLLISKLFWKKTILHIHGGGFVSFYKNCNLLEKFLIRKIFNITDSVVVLSQSWKKFFSSLVSHHKITIIPNGVNLMDFNQKTTIEDEFQFPKTSIIVSFLGTLSRDKGVNDILKAIPLVIKNQKNCVFVFAGRIEQDIYNPSKIMDIKDHVFFLGEIFGVKKIKLLLATDIFLLPSYVEGLPIVLLEAMAASLPIISTPVGAIPELVMEGINGFLIDPGDYNALAERILTLAEDKNLREKMGLNNHKKVMQEYDFRIISKKLAKLYDQLSEN